MCRRLKCRARAITKVHEPNIVILKCNVHNHGLEAYKNLPKTHVSANVIRIDKT